MDAAGWDERYSAKDYVWSLTPNQFVEKHLAELAPGDAVDVAAGEGRNAVWLASLGWNVTAVDFSSAGLDKGRRLAEEHDVTVDFVCADATTYEPANPVDLVLLSYFQVDRELQTGALEQAKTWLRPGGMVFVIAHDASNVSDGHGGPQDVQVCYTVEHTAAALAGLDIATGEVARRVVDTPDGEKVALDTLVIATRP